MTKFVKNLEVKNCSINYPVIYVSLNLYKGHSDSSIMKFLHFFLFCWLFWPARIRIRVPNLPDPLTHLNPDPKQRFCWPVLFSLSRFLAVSFPRAAGEGLQHWRQASQYTYSICLLFLIPPWFRFFQECRIDSFLWPKLERKDKIKNVYFFRF